MKPYHFYLAFNPLFNEDQTWKTQAHEFHQKLKDKKATNPDAHMYWGKIQISEYSEPLNMSNFLQTVSENNDLQMDSHLYITDYQHMWVGKVSEVLKEIPDEENTLAFYKNKKVEVWFKIVDFDLLSNNSAETSAILNQIHVDNEYYNYKIKEMTPFTSGIRFPMIVQDKTQERFFNNPGLRILKDNPLLTTQGEAMKLNNLIHSFVIPEDTFKRIPEHIRSQIVHAEILLLEAQSGGKKDRFKLEQAILTYLKCLETLLNDTFVAYLKREEGHRIWITKDRSSPKFMRSALDKDKSSLTRLKDSTETFNLSQIKMLLDTPSFFPHTSLDYVFRGKKSFWEYCRLELRSTLKNESLIELRNILTTHGDVKAHDRELLLVRNILLGVGGRGVFNNVIEAWFELSPVKLKVA
ncbi:MAG: hypothetical protein H0V66_06415 [Bdellovibrionales bacterium]|nr:hypothetical protein [Bdellovibrionales bacterium]